MNPEDLYKNGEYEELVNELKTSSDPDLLPLKAYSLQKLGRFEEAMEVWNYLISLSSDEASYYNERGVCKFNLRFRYAIEDFDKAISLDPQCAYYFSCRAYVKDKTGDTKGAVEDYGRAHELDPDDAILLNNYGLAEQKLGHTQKAREFFAKSDDLLGVRTIDSEPETSFQGPAPISTRDKIKEVQKMLSSRTEFKKFLKELFRL